VSDCKSEINQEILDINRRDKNIIIFNVPEIVSSEITDRISYDKTAVKVILEKLDIGSGQFTHVIRIGKHVNSSHRPLLVGLENRDQRDLVLRNSFRCKNFYYENNDKQVYLAPDRTAYQRQIIRNLVKELKIRRATNPNLYIRGFRIVERKGRTAEFSSGSGSTRSSSVSSSSSQAPTSPVVGSVRAASSTSVTSHAGGANNVIEHESESESVKVSLVPPVPGKPSWCAAYVPGPSEVCCDTHASLPRSLWINPDHFPDPNPRVIEYIQQYTRACASCINNNLVIGNYNTELTMERLAKLFPKQKLQ
jgi:hypothetical protein